MLAKTAMVVPQQSAYVVETLGRYSRTIQAGFHILMPFVERIAYRHNLKEEAIDIPEQVCITRDNVQVGVDGVLYLQVLDASKASYGITNYSFAIIQLAQTTLRSEIGKIELDRTFEERATINANVVSELDKASAPWGVKVLRYEIKNINPPQDVLHAMEKQMRAEREKRAVVLTSEGERDAKINQAEGEKQRVIKESEGEQAAADQRGAGRGGGDPRGRHGDRRGPAAGRRGARRPRRHRGDAAARRGGVRQAVRHARERGVEHAGRAGEPHRHRLDDRARDERREEPESGVLTWLWASSLRSIGAAAACLRVRGHGRRCAAGAAAAWRHDLHGRSLAAEGRGRTRRSAGGSPTSATRRRARMRAPAGTRVVDLAGRTVLPGLTDSHAHLADIGERELGFDLTGVESVAAMQRRLAERAAADRSPWIVGANWIESKWQPAVFPSRQDLDAVVRDRPVVLQRVDGHAVVVNSKALEIVGISRATPDPAGGQILRDPATGEPTGMLVDNAMDLVWRHVPPETDETLARHLEAGAASYVRLGWTELQYAGTDWRDDRPALPPVRLRKSEVACICRDRRAG